jgi:uncharacterized OB-fold protein
VIEVGAYIGPAPVVHPESEPYWTALGTGRLLLQRCSSCARVRFPIAPVCYVCCSLEAEWVEVPSGGSVSAVVTITRALGDPVWQKATPFRSGQFDLDVGVRVPGRLFCSCIEPPPHGCRVRGGFLVGDGFGVLCFVHDCSHWAGRVG